MPVNKGSRKKGYLGFRDESWGEVTLIGGHVGIFSRNLFPNVHVKYMNRHLFWLYCSEAVCVRCYSFEGSINIYTKRSQKARITEVLCGNGWMKQNCTGWYLDEQIPSRHFVRITGCKIDFIHMCVNISIKKVGLRTDIFGLHITPGHAMLSYSTPFLGPVLPERSPYSIQGSRTDTINNYMNHVTFWCQSRPVC